MTPGIRGLPGEEIEGFFRAAAALTSAGGDPAPGDVIAIAEKHGVQMAGAGSGLSSV